MYVRLYELARLFVGAASRRYLIAFGRVVKLILITSTHTHTLPGPIVIRWMRRYNRKPLIGAIIPSGGGSTAPLIRNDVAD